MASFVLLHILLIKRHIRIMNTQWYQKATNTREIFKKKNEKQHSKIIQFFVNELLRSLKEYLLGYWYSFHTSLWRHQSKILTFFRR